MPFTTTCRCRRLTDVLIEMQAVTPEQIDRILEEQKQTHGTLAAILLKHGLTEEETIARATALQAQLTYLEDPGPLVTTEALKRIPESLARRVLAIPLELGPEGLSIALADPHDLTNIDDLGYASNLLIRPVVSTPRRILAALDKFYGQLDTISELIAGVDLDQFEVLNREETETELGHETECEKPIVKLTNLILLEAIKQKASDIHIEPMQHLLRVRYRVDGLLHEFLSPPKSMHSALCSRIKVLAGLDIAEHRIPQDGRALVRTPEGAEVDLRVNIVPTICGEKVEIRLLPRTMEQLDIRKTGMDAGMLEDFLSLIHRPSGMILVTGPTGNGKTTLLYSALAELDSSTQHLITIEDPVEYRLENINQIQVNAKAGLTFAAGLRSILRQDPNVILVGEIRDRETAEVAIEAAMTGHLIFSTVHSIDAAHTINRLTTLGVDPFLAASALAGIISIRLVRKLCLKCREPYTPSPALAKQLGRLPDNSLFRPRGCRECRQTGYAGRTGIFELVPIDRQLSEMIQSGSSADKIQLALSKMGIRSLWATGVAKVLSGEISIEELMRVTRNVLGEADHDEH